MTLEEAIKNEEEIAIQQIEKANALDNIPLFGMSKDDVEEIKECYKCSKEHEQLAEWLKDYKRLLELTPWIFVSERYPTDENKRYLVCYEDGCITIEYLYFDGDGNPFFSEMELGVVAWMPLPEKPYIEGGEQNE